MSTTAQYASTPRQAIAAVATANTNKDGTGTIGTIFTAGASGSRVDAINIKATVTTTSGMIRVFIHNGTTGFMLTEVPVPAVTSSATANGWECQLNGNTMSQLFPIILPTTYSIRVSTNNAENFNVFVQGGDF